MKCERTLRGEFCWYCYTGAKARGCYPGHFGGPGRRPRRPKAMSNFLKAKSARPDRNGSAGKATPEGLLEECPALYEYLSVTAYDDGTPRRVSTLLLFIEDGLWKGCLNDREESRSLWASGHTVIEVCHALDKGIRENSGDWRRSQGVPNVKGGRRF